MEYMTIQKNLKSSPRKLRLVADMVRKMTPAQAVLQLQFTNTAAAPLLAKVIKTVLANGGNGENLVFKSIEVNEGMKMRRIRVGTAGRGRNRPYKKRMSNVKIVVTDDQTPIQAVGAKLKKDVVKKIEENTKVVEPKLEEKDKQSLSPDDDENVVVEGEVVEEEKK